ITYAENFMRSSVVPHTIASETAQNMNWNSMKAAVEPPTVPATRPVEMFSPKLKKRASSPISQPAPPKAIPNPTAHQAIVAIEKFARIFTTPWPTFWPSEKPISSRAKPACMNMTRTVATITQVVSMLPASVSSAASIGADASLGDCCHPHRRTGRRDGLYPGVEDSTEVFRPRVERSAEPGVPGPEDEAEPSQHGHQDAPEDRIHD